MQASCLSRTCAVISEGIDCSICENLLCTVQVNRRTVSINDAAINIAPMIHTMPLDMVLLIRTGPDSSVVISTLL